MRRDSKNIDQLYQEKLKDFEVTPNDTVWDNISSQINLNTRKRKVIPLWVRLSSIAAGVILIVTLGNTLFFDDDNPKIEETIVDTKQDVLSDSEEPDAPINEDTFVASDNENAIEDNTIKQNNPSEDGLTNETNKENNPIINTKNNKEAVASNVNDANAKDTKAVIDTSQKILNNEDTLSKVAEQKNRIDNTNDANTIDKTLVNSEIEKSKKSAEKVAEANDASSLEKSTEQTDETDKVSLTDEIAATEAVLEDEDIKEEIDRWSVASNIAPVYFNSLGNGSSIHTQFNNNAKSGAINMSYGVSVSYALTEKLSVRGGVNKVNLGYSTNDVVVYNNIQVITDDLLLRNIDLNKQAEDMSFISAESFNFAQVPGVLSNHLNASIDQELGFYEIPLELKYRLTEKNLKINLLGGVSALFLDNNKVYSVFDGQTTLIGKATNINKTSYSANLGVGFDFKVSNNINLNFEPMFKYQLNTFRNTSGNFKPYFIGVYSGLSFKF